MFKVQPRSKAKAAAEAKGPPPPRSAATEATMPGLAPEPKPHPKRSMPPASATPPARAASRAPEAARPKNAVSEGQARLGGGAEKDPDQRAEPAPLSPEAEGRPGCVALGFRVQGCSGLLAHGLIQMYILARS